MYNYLKIKGRMNSDHLLEVKFYYTEMKETCLQSSEEMELKFRIGLFCSTLLKEH
jgi:hypothetical protein